MQRVGVGCRCKVTVKSYISLHPHMYQWYHRSPEMHSNFVNWLQQCGTSAPLCLHLLFHRMRRALSLLTSVLCDRAINCYNRLRQMLTDRPDASFSLHFIFRVPFSSYHPFFLYLCELSSHSPCDQMSLHVKQLHLKTPTHVAASCSSIPGHQSKPEKNTKGETGCIC